MNSLEHATYLYGNTKIISLYLQSGLIKQIQAFRDLHFFLICFEKAADIIETAKSF